MTLRVEPSGTGPDAIRLRTGDVVGSRYRLERAIEDDAGGAVWLAVDEVLQRHVAVRLPADRGPGHLQRFTEDARAAAGLWHPNLVQIFDFGVTDGQAFLVMEHMPRGSLDERFRRGPVSAAQLRRAACELLSALEYIHARGRVHGDVRPSRIVLDGDGRAHLSGFGMLPAGSPGSPTEDLRALGRLVAAAPCPHRHDPALNQLVAELLAPALRAGGRRPYVAPSSRGVCTDTGGQATQEFDVLRLVADDTEKMAVVPIRFGPIRASRYERRGSIRRRRARAQRA